MSNIYTNPLPEGTGDRVRAVDPAVRVQYVLGDVLGMNTVYRIAHVLSRGGYDGAGQEEGDGGGVVEPEDAGVDGDMVGLHQTLQTSEYFDHLSPQPSRFTDTCSTAISNTQTDIFNFTDFKDFIFFIDFPVFTATKFMFSLFYFEKPMPRTCGILTNHWGRNS